MWEASAHKKAIHVQVQHSCIVPISQFYCWGEKTCTFFLGKLKYIGLAWHDLWDAWFLLFTIIVHSINITNNNNEVYCGYQFGKFFFWPCPFLLSLRCIILCTYLSQVRKMNIFQEFIWFALCFPLFSVYYARSTGYPKLKIAFPIIILAVFVIIKLN